MRVALVSPIWHEAHFNSGWHQITAGIRYLVRRVVPDVVFVPVEMMRDVSEHWQAAATCDAVILCGNPRFSMSAGSFWECDIWSRLAGLQAAGINVIDGWAGASHSGGVPLEDMADAILAFPRSAFYLKLAAKIHRRITRDALMQRIYERAGIASTLLPCSSWYAAAEFGINAGARNGCAVVLHEAGLDMVGKIIEQTGEGARVIASTFDDYAAARARGISAELMPDAASLLRVYAGCNRVAAMRLHAAIPAASLGCEVGSISLDSRTLALEPFGLPSIPLDRVAEDEIAFGKAKAPDEAAVLATVKEALC